MVSFLRCMNQAQTVFTSSLTVPFTSPLNIHFRPFATAAANMVRPTKLRGRAFYESLGSPKYIIAPMVDQSEFAWRLLTRSFLPAEQRTSVLAYSPMLHAKLFADGPKYRAAHFEPLKPPLSLPESGDQAQTQNYSLEDLYLDGNGAPEVGDRPLFVQFCANDPDAFLEAARIVAPFCDAVDLNLGCPQGIAKRGNYGAFLQEDWETIKELIETLNEQLDVPVTAKMRVLETPEKTLEYAQMILKAGASILTVHGRQREQKGHNTGLADWSIIRYLREQLPPETVIFANGNILQHDDLQRCLDETKADGVMTAEGNLYDPSIFAQAPPLGEEGREYWRGRDGKGGYRMDAVLRRYLDIIHRHVLGHEPPARAPLFIPSDITSTASKANSQAFAVEDGDSDSASQPPTKKLKREHKKQEKKTGGKTEKCTNPNLTAMQPHCFHILRSLVSEHHNVRDALAQCRSGDIDAYEQVLSLTEGAVRQGLLAYESNPSAFEEDREGDKCDGVSAVIDDAESSTEAVRRCRRPWWVCQPRVRPLPKEALAKGSLQLSKKEKARLAEQEAMTPTAANRMNGKTEAAPDGTKNSAEREVTTKGATVEIPREGLVCG